MIDPTHRIEVFYDGGCSICDREAQLWRRLDQRQELKLIDIASPDFDAADHGLDAADVQRFMHVKTSDGRVFVGVDALRRVWRELPGLSALAHLSCLPGIDQLVRMAYQAFARNRYRFARRCADGTCEQPRAVLDARSTARRRPDARLTHNGVHAMNGTLRQPPGSATLYVTSRHTKARPGRRRHDFLQEGYPPGCHGLRNLKTDSATAVRCMTPVMQSETKAVSN